MAVSYADAIYLSRIKDHPEVWSYLGLVKNNQLSGFFDSLFGSVGDLFSTSNLATTAPLVTGGVLMLNPHLRKKYALPIIGGSLGLAALGHYLTNNTQDVSNNVDAGVAKIQQRLAQERAAGSGNLLGATIQTAPGQTMSLGDALGQLGGTAIKIKLMQAMAKASQKTGMSESQIYNQTLAYVTAHQKEFQQAGYSDPREAVAAILGKNYGYPPQPNEGIGKYIGTAQNYLPYILIGGGLLFVVMMSKK